MLGPGTARLDAASVELWRGFALRGRDPTRSPGPQPMRVRGHAASVDVTLGVRHVDTGGAVDVKTFVRGSAFTGNRNLRTLATSEVHMNSNIFRTLAGMAWAAALIAGAAPANAVAITSQVGNYGTCSNSYTNRANHYCATSQMAMPDDGWYTSYEQQIKFVSTACSAGGCFVSASAVATDAVYSTGRKPVTGSNACGVYWVHFLGSCAC
jgi:hypothetical protein